MVKCRLHTHFEVLRGVPTRIDVTPNGGGEHDERAVLESVIEAGRLYVTDRGYAKFLLFNKIVAAMGGRMALWFAVVSWPALWFPGPVVS